MSIEFSSKGTRFVSGKKNKPDFKYHFINDNNIEQVKQELKQMGIEQE